MIKPKNYGYIFVLPFFVGVLVFQAYPLINTLFTSFTDDSMRTLDLLPNFVGWDNYLFEMQSELFQKTIVNTLVMTGAALVLQFLLALLIAAFLTSSDLGIRGKNTWQVLFFLPSQISVSILSLYIVFFFSDQGIIANVLKSMDPTQATDFFGSPLSAWVFIVGGTVFLSFGITAYFLVNSIRSIPRAIFEAAMIDGASSRQVYFRISLPSLQPVLVFLVVISLILDLCMFDVPYALFPSSGGGFSPVIGTDGGVGQTGITMGTYAYQRSFIWDSDLGSGASVVMIVFVVISSLSLAYFRWTKRTSQEFQVIR